ncbi:MAG: hypothetical protein EHM74_05765 [Hyphomicrobiales bacterium]|jgi:hypothetical protein|nr:MAG: hypothetical protein EHM74_05765 [Hyphomicrobiales bacterium]
MRIVRTLLVLGGIAVFLPAPPGDHPTGSQEERPAAPQGLLATTALAVADLFDLCAEGDWTCDLAGRSAAHLESKVKYSAWLAYDWAVTPSPRARLEVGDAGDGTSSSDSSASMPNASTLRLDDMVPAWRGPAPQNKG